MKIRKQKTDQNERRRPITTSRPGVFSYYSQRSSTPDLNLQLQPRKETTSKKSKRFRLGLLPSYIALVVVSGALIYSLWLQPLPRMYVTNQPGTVYRSSDEYRQQTEMIWRHSILNQTKLTVHTKQLQREILDHFSEISEVRIDLPLLGRRPAITLVPAKPAFELISGNGVYYVSATGKVMAQTKEVSKNQVNNLPLVLDETGLKAEVGKIVLPAHQASYLSVLFDQLVAARVDVQSITLPSTAANQADVRIKDKQYYIKFQINSDVRQSVGSYLAVRDKMQAEGINPKQYIDVRVDEKVFYQ